MSRTPLSAALLVALLMQLLLSTPASAVPTSGFTTDPVAGGVTITSYTGSLAALARDGAELDLQACFATVDGVFVGYAFSAPAFVNARFTAEFTGGLADQGLVCRRAAERTAAVGSIFDEAQVVSFYGHPGFPVMGILGETGATDAAAGVEIWARQYAAHTERNVIPALHLIVGVAQRDPGSDGIYLSRLADEVIAEYVTATRDRGQLLFLDTQIGWSDPLTEAQALERWLREPHVHLAVDPEFAMRSYGVAPGQRIGTVTGAELNSVQAYLSALARDHDLPHRILVVHQFRDDMITDPGAISTYGFVDLVIDMDGFGPRGTKLWGYERYALADYAQYAGFKLFFDWDTPLMSPEEVQRLDRPPDLVIYQ